MPRKIKELQENTFKLGKQTVQRRKRGQRGKDKKKRARNPIENFGPNASVKGDVRGGGRKPGTPNVMTRQAKENIAELFDRLGGVDGMLKWAQRNNKNLTSFYTHIYVKLIPIHVQAKIDATLQGDSAAAVALERILTGVLAARRGSDQKAPVVIDARPNGAASPQLVLPSAGGSETATDST